MIHKDIPIFGVKRELFLKKRAASVAARKAEGDTVEMYGQKWANIVVDPGDEVICDGCNALIEDKIVLHVNHGSRVECPACIKNWVNPEEDVEVESENCKQCDAILPAPPDHNTCDNCGEEQS